MKIRLRLRRASFKSGFILSNDEQGNVRDEIEDQDKNLHCSKERVEEDVERFFGECEPFAVHPVDKIAGEDPHNKRKKQQCPVQNRAPHKKRSDGSDIHNKSPYFLLRQIIALNWAESKRNRTQNSEYPDEIAETSPMG